MQHKESGILFLIIYNSYNIPANNDRKGVIGVNLLGGCWFAHIYLNVMNL